MARRRISLLTAAPFLALCLALLSSGCREQEAEKPAAVSPSAPVQEGRTEGDKPPKGQGVFATCAAFSPDNKFVLLGFDGDGGRKNKRQRRTALANSFVLWEVESGKEIRTFNAHLEGVTFVGWFPDGIHVLSGGNDGLFRVWNVQTGHEVRRFDTGYKGFRGVLSPDGKQVFLHDVGKVEVWDVEKGERINPTTMPKEYAGPVVLSQDGQRAFVASKSLSLWDLKKGTALHEFKFTRIGTGEKLSQIFDHAEGLVPFPLGKFRAPMVNSNKDLWPGRTGLVQKGPARRPAVQNGQENA